MISISLIVPTHYYYGINSLLHRNANFSYFQILNKTLFGLIHASMFFINHPYQMVLKG